MFIEWYLSALKHTKRSLESNLKFQIKKYNRNLIQKDQLSRKQYLQFN